MSEQLTHVSHDYIRYANCWEDADLLLKGLEIQEGDRVLSIGSAGDNSFSLLVGDPELVVAVDINQIQLNVIELKKAAFKALEHSEFLEFLGFADCADRQALFDRVKVHLSPEMQTFWSNRLEEIQLGIIYQGKFEKYFGLFQKRILPLIHSRGRIAQLFKAKTRDEQEKFYARKWNTIRWRMLFKIFFSRFVMGRFGRDPEFLKEVETSVSTYILSQAKRHLSSVACQRNYFLHFIMTHHFGEGLPHYARKENYAMIKERVDRVVVYYGLAEDAFASYSRFNKFNLSNIFEYMNPGIFGEVVQNLVDNGLPGSRYAYWNLMVPRQMAQINDELMRREELSSELTEQDKGFFYMSFNIDVKNE